MPWRWQIPHRSKHPGHEDRRAAEDGGGGGAKGLPKRRGWEEGGGEEGQGLPGKRFQSIQDFGVHRNLPLIRPTPRQGRSGSSTPGPRAGYAAARPFPGESPGPFAPAGSGATAEARQDRKESTVRLVTVYQYGPNEIRNAESARNAMEILESHGWVLPSEEGRDGKGRNNEWKVRLNPGEKQTRETANSANLANSPSSNPDY